MKNWESQETILKTIPNNNNQTQLKNITKKIINTMNLSLKFSIINDIIAIINSLSSTLLNIQFNNYQKLKKIFYKNDFL